MPELRFHPHLGRWQPAVAVRAVGVRPAVALRAGPRGRRAVCLRARPHARVVVVRRRPGGAPRKGCPVLRPHTRGRGAGALADAVAFACSPEPRRSLHNRGGPRAGERTAHAGALGGHIRIHRRSVRAADRRADSELPDPGRGHGSRRPSAGCGRPGPQCAPLGAFERPAAALHPRRPQRIDSRRSRGLSPRRRGR